MKRQIKRILSKRLLPFVLAFACVFTTITPITASADSGDKKTFYSIQGQLKHYLCWSGASGTSDLYGHHLGTTKTSTSEMLKIGKVAFCLQHDQSPPATTGTSYTSIGKPAKNEYLCVYYGYASDTFASKFSLNKNESYYATECAIWGIKGQLNKNASATVANQFKYIKAKSGVTNSANVLKAAKWLMQRVIDNPDDMTVPALTADTSDSKIAITTNNKNRVVSGNKMQIGSFTVNEDYSSLTLTSAPSGAKIVKNSSNNKKFWIEMSLADYTKASKNGKLSFKISVTSTKRYIVAEKYQLSGKQDLLYVVGKGTPKTATNSFDITNPTGRITVVKQDKSTGAVLSGAKFKITNKTDGTSSTVTTNTLGTATKSNLLFGTYTVVETAAPAGYDLDSTVYTVTVDSDTPTVTVTHKNTLSSARISCTRAKRYSSLHRDVR